MLNDSLIRARLFFRVCATTVAILLPSIAAAIPIIYEFSSGSATIRGTLEGESQTIFEGSASIQIPLVDITAVIDHDLGTYGRLESLTVVGGDLSIDLDESRVALDTLSVLSPTISSLGDADLNVFGQFALQTQINAVIAGTYPGGGPFGPESIESEANTGSAAGIVAISGDQILIQVVGITVASFDQFGNPDPNAPNIELKADFAFIGRAVTAIPEPSASLLFMMGLVAAGTSLWRQRG